METTIGEDSEVTIPSTQHGRASKEYDLTCFQICDISLNACAQPASPGHSRGVSISQLRTHTRNLNASAIEIESPVRHPQPPIFSV
eukprot:8866848-Karenia_brevis.AAC.1